MSLAARPQRILGPSSIGDKVAGSLSFEVLNARAERVDRVLNFRVLPQLGIHAALIGACILIDTGTVPIPARLYFYLAAGFVVAFVAGHLRGWKGSGLLCAAAAFATAAAVTAKTGGTNPILVIGGVWALMAIVMVRFHVSRREIMFAPIYAAILILLTTEDASAFALYAPVFLFGMAAVVIGKNIGWSVGLFLGLFLLISNRFDETTLAVVGGLSIVGIVLVLIYVARSVSTAHSDTRNFLSQGVGAWMFVALVNVFVTLDAWVVPLVMANFFLIVALFKRGMTGWPTAFAWLSIAILLAFWSYLVEDSYPQLYVWLAVTVIAAKLIDLAARGMKSPLVGKVAGLILLFAALFPTIIAVTLKWAEELPAGLAALKAWEHGALPKLPVAILASILVAASCYKPIGPQIQMPWWRGVMRPRHVLFFRTSLRAAGQWVSAVPIIGGPLRAVGEAFKALRYLKTGGQRLRSADIMLIMMVMLLYWTLRIIARLFLDAAIAPGEPGPGMGWAAGAVAASACGLLFYGLGLWLRQFLFFFMGALLVICQFVFTLVADWSTIEAGQVGLLGMVLGVVLVICVGIRSLYGEAFGAAAAVPKRP